MIVQRLLRQEVEKLFNEGIKIAKKDIINKDIETAIDKIKKRFEEQISKITEFTTINEGEQLLTRVKEFDYKSNLLGLVESQLIIDKMRNPTPYDHFWEMIPKLIRDHGYVGGRLLSPDNPDSSSQFLKNHAYELDLVIDELSPSDEIRYRPIYEKIAIVASGIMARLGMITEERLGLDEVIYNTLIAMAALDRIVEARDMCWIKYHNTEGETFYVGMNNKRSEDYLSKIRQLHKKATDAKQEVRFIASDIDSEYPILVDKYLHSKEDEFKSLMEKEGIEEKTIDGKFVYLIRPVTVSRPPMLYIGLDGHVYSSLEVKNKADEDFIKNLGRFR